MFFVKSKQKNTVSNANDLQQAVSEVLQQCSSVVGRTMGPGGRPVLIDRVNQPPLITKDGVTVLKHMGFKDPIHNLVLDTTKEIALNTAKEAGDGTTTSIVLANAIYNEANAYLKANPKLSPQKFLREIDACYKTVICPTLQKLSSKIENDYDLRDVAMISSNGDKELSDAVVKAILASGEEGTVLVNEDQGGQLRVDTLEGYVCTTGYRELGYIGNRFITDKANQCTSLSQTKVILFDGAVNDMSLMTAVFMAYNSDPGLAGRPMVIVAHSFSDAIIEKCLVNTKSGQPIIPVKAPHSSLPNSKSIFLQDLAALTGAKIHDPVSAVNFDIPDFGEAEKFKMDNYETFFQCEIDSDRVSARVEELKALLATCQSEFDRSHVRSHISKLIGGICTIWVGGMTEAEIRERKDRLQDALEAVRSAIAEGCCAGGGVTYLALGKAIIAHPDYTKYQGSWDVLVKALYAPMRMILANCGESEIEGEFLVKVVGGFIKGGEVVKPTITYDAANHVYVNPSESGIIEPAKVLRVAIGNSLSIATILATLGGIISSSVNPDLEAQMDAASSALKNIHGGASDE